MSDTSIGREDPVPAKGVKTQATVEGVDAQNANEFDMRHGLAGVEAKSVGKGDDQPDPEGEAPKAQPLNKLGLKHGESPFGYKE